MPARQRKFVALLALLPYLAAYLLGAALLGEKVPAHWWAQVPFYAIAGVLWAFPVILMMRWANGGDDGRGGHSPDNGS